MFQGRRHYDKGQLRFRNELLNVLKGIACMGVVFIHIKFPGLVGEIVSKFFNFAVPVFFMTAGYYSFGCTENAVKRKLAKIIKIFIYAYVCFFSYHIVAEKVRGGNPGMACS